MWDSFLAGMATSIMLKENNADGDNDFADMEHMNITVITSNKPYGVMDGSNPFFHGRNKPKFGLQRNGVHSGHVQTGLRDPFCVALNGSGLCKVIGLFLNFFLSLDVLFMLLMYLFRMDIPKRLMVEEYVFVLL